jgi:tyrosyl-tRNA synthetase
MELLTRNVAEAIDKENLVRKLKSGQKLVIKLGRDPRTPNLHLGHSVPLRKLRAFQLAGHQIVIVIGDFTARLGDPNAPDSSRDILGEAALERNVKEIKKSFFKILDPKKTKFTYNSAWLGKLKMGDIINLAANFTVQQNIERDLFQRRLESGKPIGLHEFLYPLMQAYDSVFLKPDLEVGGTDQTFNLLAGRTLMKAEGLTPQDILTTPMLIGTDGREMHSSWGNTISLTDTPTDMFGKLLGVRDELIIRYMELTTDLSEAEINAMTNRLRNGTLTHLEAKKILAREIVTLYHGAKDAAEAQSEFERVIQAKGLPDDRSSLSLGGVGSIGILDLLIESGLAKSRGEAKRLVTQGGVDIVEVDRSSIVGRMTLKDAEAQVRPHHKRQTIIQVGKRKAVEVRP